MRKKTDPAADQSAEFMTALKQISGERGIDENIIYEAIETSLVTACKKNYGNTDNIRVDIDRRTGKVQVLAQKTVAASVTNPLTEIELEEAKRVNLRYELGDLIDIEITPRNFGRVAAQTAKQVVVQKFREAERELLYNEYMAKEHGMVTGIVQRKEKRNVIVTLGKVDAVLPASEQAPGEEYNLQDRLKLYVQEVRQTPKGPSITVSRAAPEMIEKLFERETPEIMDGTVEVRGIAREVGSRSKMAVYSNDPAVDPIGACVGQNQMRVAIVLKQLGNEKVDILEWSGIPEIYIARALAPAKVLTVVCYPEERLAHVVVSDNQLSLAIGKAGQNARLAAKLAGWRIDIKSETQAEELDFIPIDAIERFWELYEKAGVEQ
ncbi:MAG: transcription termination factor NusA [Clostridiales bacterium]|jgi:N utilization substance protein A|nr:transcription termination factor NusA [Clostridiales bacterium]